MSPRTLASLLLSTLVLSAGIAPAAAGGLTPEILWSLTRLGDPQPSPDGSLIAFTGRAYDVAGNSSTSSLYVIAAGGGEPRRLTRAPSHDGSPRWLPDGRTLLFTSDRDGSSQIWALDVDGGEPWVVSDLPVDVGGFVIGADGSRLVVALDVYPGCEDLDCTVKRAAEADKAPARVYDELLFRHWDTWEDGRRSHLFVADLKRDPAGRPTALGAPRDLMKGMDADSPTHPFGGMEEVALSPDGRSVVFAAKSLPGSEAAWSTDVDLFVVPMNGSQAPVKITVDNPAWDTAPAFSPDGRWLAHTAMKRPGFEADRFGLVLRPVARGGAIGAPRLLTDDWDRSIGSLAWSPDSLSLVVSAEETGRTKIFSVSVPDGEVKPLVEEHHNTGVTVAADGAVVFMQDSLMTPADLHIMPRGEQPRALTRINAAIMADVEMPAPEDFWFNGAGGDKVHGWLVRPVGYDPAKRYPVAFLIHGGPQGSWGDDFHYRWNPQIYAGAGYMALAINFHGSTGYGQAFTDAISGDWGGAPYQDLMKGLDVFLAAEKAADGKRVCALGASYGGYMINWIAGQTDRFACLINHDGLFDLRSMYYTTEELWFPEWEFGGTPYGNPQGFERWNPSAHIDKWTTPTLIIHGGRDYRVPETEGFATFTALRRRGVPARLVHYPSENHWVLKPQGALFWHRQVLDWMARWAGDSGD